jgi:hypothetical protein
MDKEQIEKLAEIYNYNMNNAVLVAKICDEVLDRSGALLGEVRQVARDLRTLPTRKTNG